MTTTFTTALYVASSLLQADAAILGFGAVFIIYKLQSLDSTYQDAFRTCLSASSAQVAEIAKLIVVAPDLERKNKLLESLVGNHYYPHLSRLVSIPLRQEEVKTSIKWPIIAVSLHISLSAIILWLIPNIHAAGGDNSIFLAAGFDVFLFMLLICYVGVLASRMVK
jgi:hypothetical protein